MGGTTTIASTDFQLTYFTEAAGDPPVDRVTAVVARRGVGLRSESHGRALRRALLTWLRPSSRPPDPRTGWQLPPGWNGASDGGGPREVLHSAARRAVRVAGRDYPFPADGRALVLLVDDRTGAGTAEAAVVVHAVAIPPVPSAGAGRGLSEAEHVRRRQEASERTRRAVLRALRDDPAVRAFLPDGAWEAA